MKLCGNFCGTVTKLYNNKTPLKWAINTLFSPETGQVRAEHDFKYNGQFLNNGSQNIIRNLYGLKEQFKLRFISKDGANLCIFHGDIKV